MQKQEFLSGTELVIDNELRKIVADFHHKMESVDANIQKFHEDQKNFLSNCFVTGTWIPSRVIDEQHVYRDKVVLSLKKSAWKAVYIHLNIERIATAKDKSRFEQAMESPPEFTAENLKAVFGSYMDNPLDNILRGLAEVFYDLDPVFKSHEKMKIGVKGLPKRVILSGFNSYSMYGHTKLSNLLNALAVYQNKPLVTYSEVEQIIKDESKGSKEWEGVVYKDGKNVPCMYPGRGVRVRKYQNGNAHVFFEPETLRDVNKALAQYYGEVLPDCHEPSEPVKKQESKEVSKDLQYYPTPEDVVERMLRDVWIKEGVKVLEPSCGCGRIMDAVKALGGEVFGIEIDRGRVDEARRKGHQVLTANFLEVHPTQIYDFVIMNPPFYGKHYAKHIKHAMEFLKDDGKLVSVLPSTARYDHGLIEAMPYKHRWEDLPVGSFSQSGTNVNTSILTMFK